MTIAGNPSTHYQQGVNAGRWQDDVAQRRVLVELDRIHQALAATPAAHWWSALLAHKPNGSAVAGLYLWGDVGRGKTFLMDLFFHAVPLEKKLRLHFHRFMGRVHAELKKRTGREDPLKDVATQFAAHARLLCLDEFYVSDIGDAMILSRLLQHLFEQGVTLVTTSNTAPDQLYRDGLQRARFLPAIALIKQHCHVLPLQADQDYRLRALTQAPLYQYPWGDAAERALAACFERIAPGRRHSEHEINVNGRAIPVKCRADGVIWFDFAALCDGPRAVADYIELAQSFHSVVISHVPQFTATLEDQARRFVNLIDEFYDRNVNVVLSAAVPIVDLYQAERLRTEFDRTLSRLIEMQSTHYLARPHKP